MSEFLEKAQGTIGDHDEAVDSGLDKAGTAADDKTGGKFGDKIDAGVDAAQERTGSGDTTGAVGEPA